MQARVRPQGDSPSPSASALLAVGRPPLGLSRLPLYRSLGRPRPVSSSLALLLRAEPTDLRRAWGWPASPFFARFLAPRVHPTDRRLSCPPGDGDADHPVAIG